MSVLVFIDESRWERPGKKDYYATVAGVAFEEAAYDDFCRKLLRLKGRFFKRPGISDYALQGRLLLSNRALASFRKVEFVLELFSLCRLKNVVTFSTSRKCTPGNGRGNSRKVPAALQKGIISGSDRFNEETVSLLLAYLIERVNSFMLETHPGEMAKLIFGSEELQKDRFLASSVMNFMYKTSLGTGFHGMLGTPFFAPASHSPGVQLADLFAYIINQHHGGRKEMKDFFAEVESMQFVSSIEQEEYELRGMNLIE